MTCNDIISQILLRNLFWCINENVTDYGYANHHDSMKERERGGIKEVSSFWNTRHIYKISILSLGGKYF